MGCYMNNSPFLSCECGHGRARHTGRTPVAFATEKRNLKILAVLLAAKSDPMITDATGRMPLHCAVENNDLDCTRALLAAKANPTVTYANIKTPLDLAVARGHQNVV